MTFEYGIGCEPIEKQANRQGYTLGKYAEHIEKLMASYNMLRMNLLLTDAQAESILKKIHKKVNENIRKIESDG
jgi:hypothetical protein